MADNILTQELLKSILEYNPDTGIFTRIKPCSGIKVGDIAGRLDSKGYNQIMISGVRVLAHRLAWLYMTGSLPDGGLDHINGIRNDNSFNNLRQITHAQNMQNRRNAYKNSKTKLLGVTFMKQINKWAARINVNGKSKYLGVFPTPEDAHNAYIQAKRKHHEYCTI